jgi:hypothetical protein
MTLSRKAFWIGGGLVALAALIVVLVLAYSGGGSGGGYSSYPSSGIADQASRQHSSWGREDGKSSAFGSPPGPFARCDIGSP